MVELPFQLLDLALQANAKRGMTGTIVYTVIVSGQTFPMISVMGQSEQEAYEYCLAIFGSRFEGFKERR